MCPRQPNCPASSTRTPSAAGSIICGSDRCSASPWEQSAPSSASGSANPRRPLPPVNGRVASATILVCASEREEHETYAASLFGSRTRWIAPKGTSHKTCWGLSHNSSLPTLLTLSTRTTMNVPSWSLTRTLSPRRGTRANVMPRQCLTVPAQSLSIADHDVNWRDRTQNPSRENGFHRLLFGTGKLTRLPQIGVIEKHPSAALRGSWGIGRLLDISTPMRTRSDWPCLLPGNYIWLCATIRSERISAFSAPFPSPRPRASPAA